MDVDVFLFFFQNGSWGLRLVLLQKEAFYCIYANQLNLYLAKHRGSRRAKPNITASIMPGRNLAHTHGEQNYRHYVWICLTSSVQLFCGFLKVSAVSGYA